jgi:hypothetical protein
MRSMTIAAAVLIPSFVALASIGFGHWKDAPQLAVIPTEGPLVDPVWDDVTYDKIVCGSGRTAHGCHPRRHRFSLILTSNIDRQVKTIEIEGFDDWWSCEKQRATNQVRFPGGKVYLDDSGDPDDPEWMMFSCADIGIPPIPSAKGIAQ